MQSKQKCAKCDDSGYIQDGQYCRHSCECGWAMSQMEKKLDGVSMSDLLDYAQMRISDKKHGRSLVAKLLGSIKSKKKAKSSRLNGKKGGRPSSLKMGKK